VNAQDRHIGRDLFVMEDMGAPVAQILFRHRCDSRYLGDAIDVKQGSQCHPHAHGDGQIGNDGYRVIAYGDWEKPSHSDFPSAKALIETLQAVLPNFALSGFSLDPLGENQGSIVFAGEILLSARQLSGLGLR
jgi:hypothetical protein